MPTLILEGHIEALQPITVAVPNENALNKHVHMMSRFDAQGQRQVVPCLTGGNIKGALRNMGGMPALAEVYGADPSDPSTFGVFSIDQVYNASSGGLVGTDKNTAEDLLKARDNRKKDIHNSLWGSMRLKMKGLVEIDFALPDSDIPYAVNQLRDKTYGARRDPYRQDPGLLNRHSEEDVADFVETLDMSKRLSSLRGQLKKVEDELKKLRGKGKDDAASNTAEVQALNVKRDDLKEQAKQLQAEGAESIGRTLDPLEYIAAGVRLKHGMRVVNGDAATIGYFLRCLAHFSNHARLGGHASTGFGQVRMEYALRIRRGVETEEAGRIVVAPYHFDLDSDHPFILEAQEAFKAAAKDAKAHFALDLGDKA